MTELPARRVWAGRQAVAALGVIGVMAVWRGVLLRDSYFNQDDFVLTSLGRDRPLTWDYLMEPWIGHVTPAQQLAYWVAARWAPLDWPPTAMFILALQTLTCVVMWHVLTRILPGRWVRVPLLAVLAWSPMTLATTLWWVAAMCLWPHLFFSLLAVLFLLRAHQGAGRRWVNLTVCLLATVAGLTWHERAVLIAPVMLGVAALLEDDGGPVRRLWAALRAYPGLWLTYTVGLAAYLYAHTRITAVEGGGNTLPESLKIAVTYLGENTVPGLMGGPWFAEVNGGAVAPPGWVTVASWVLAVGLAVLLVRRGGKAAPWALVFLFLYIVGDLLMLLAGRGGFGRVIALDPRYTADIVHVAVLAVALALRDSPPLLRMRRVTTVSSPRIRTFGLVAGTAGYLVLSILGSNVLVPHFQNREDRAYLTQLRADLAADPNSVIVDELAPPELVLPLFGDESALSRILAPLPESPAFDQPSARLKVVDSGGRLHLVDLFGAIPADNGPVPGCGYPVSSVRKWIPLRVGISGRLVVRLGYFTDTETTVEVTGRDHVSVFLARPGPNVMFVPLPFSGEDLTGLHLRVDGPGTICVSELAAGFPVVQ
ncbi:hypothetical protein [Nocardioides dilutus]